LADVTATAVRALMLYCLAEHQSGHASTIRVTAQGASFSISDNGRGHPLDKTVEGTSYLQFIYTHFDYPFEAGRTAPVQLQGIGMSLVNALCSNLQLVVKKPGAVLTLQFKDGKLVHSRRVDQTSADTGITVSATIAPHLCTRWVDASGLQAWLEGVLATAPTLTLFFNGRQL
jgi:DNA gyrase/topoisomerase IV subunit B